MYKQYILSITIFILYWNLRKIDYDTYYYFAKASMIWRKECVQQNSETLVSYLAIRQATVFLLARHDEH